MAVVIKGITVGQTNEKDQFQFRITEYICKAPISARFKLWVFPKISFINIFPSLAILSHVDKTKSTKLTPNFPPSIDQTFPVIIENDIFYLIVHFFLKKNVYCILISRKWIQNDKYFFKSSHNVPARKTDVILYDVAAKICQFDVTSICTNTVRSV